jgi:hypothetical protein
VIEIHKSVQESCKSYLRRQNQTHTLT